MQNPLKTQAIKAFLTKFAPPDLAELYSYNMEVQVTVARDNGERVEGEYKGRVYQAYTNGLETWKPIRIPRNANTVPEYEDTPMGYDLAAHAEGIGMTGWDWVAKESRWVAFDFDAITGHSEKHSKKLTEAQLDEIRQALHNVPCVTIRRSTGGKGLHLYVFLEPVATANHNEHAAVARAVLSHLSGLTGFDLPSKVDICGGNMWVWHRKMAGTGGLTIVKRADVLMRVPENWREYTKVVSGARSRVLPRFVEDQLPTREDADSVFEELTGQRIRVKPDETHKRVMDWLFTNYGSCSWWEAEHHMLVTHTAALKRCHDELALRGAFETNAVGTELGSDYNCFMFPISRGAWAVRRFTLGVAEHPTWEQDGAQWTRCFYNREPDLHSAARLHGGVERAEGGYWFQMADEAQKAAALLGVDLGLPPWITNKPTILKIHKSGRLVAEVEKDSTSANMKDWLVKGKKFERVFSMRQAGSTSEPEALKIDDSLRHLISERGEDCGWVIRTDGNWHSEPYHHVKVWLTGQGHKDPAFILSSSISQCWMLVNRPFAPEYPKDRQWNRDAAQLRFKPTQDRDDLKYPTWMRILRHVGKSLDYAVSLNDWCKTNSILTGSDYLKCWIASLLQEPMEPLPYLFFHGPQNSGKSIFHEALSLLMTKGIVRADLALTNQQGFNGEIAQAVLCVVEETDLKKNQVAYNRIKDWVTSRELPVHPKNKTPYSAPNSTHWVQCANSHTACPIFPGDTRITMILVDSLDPKDLIPKKLMIPLLEAEAPDFLAEVLGLELPASNDRLNVPVVTTEDKTDAEYFNKSYLELFVEEKCFAAPGHRVRFKEFYDRFIEYVPAEFSHHWSAKRVGSEFPRHYAKGRDRSTNEVWIGNLSFTKIEEKDYGPRYILRDGKLYVDDQTPSKALPVANGAH
jgi:hypothetical protein